MIITITFNTGFDEIFVVSGIQPGGVSDVQSYRSLPSGKGINAARAIHALGGHAHAIAFVAENDSPVFGQSLSAEGIRGSFVTVAGSMRRNLTVIDYNAKQPASHFRAGGFNFENEGPLKALLTIVCANVRPGDIVSLHGSTPGGFAADAWARVAKIAHDCGAQILLDVYGAPLPIALESVQYLACKANREEIAILPAVGGCSGDRGVFAALQAMIRKGVKFAFVTLGARGIAFIDGGQCWRASCPAPQEIVFVGAGDACMAALALALDRGASSSRELAKLMVSVGAAYVAGTGTNVLEQTARRLIDTVRIEPLLEY